MLFKTLAAGQNPVAHFYAPQHSSLQYQMADFHVQHIASDLIRQILEVRSRILGTFSIVAILVVVFLFETLIASSLDYANPEAMLDATRWKSAIAILFGPLVHQTTNHLVKNLTSLVLVGAYVEYAYGERRLYTFTAITGYASVWAVVVYGMAGSVGISGATFGLWGWAAVHATARLVRLVEDPSMLWLFAHLVPLSIGLAQVQTSVQALLAGRLGGSEISHFVGLVMGVSMGAFLLTRSDQLAGRYQDPKSPDGETKNHDINP
jgi:membrane associated rhomboid family serine protease